MKRNTVFGFALVSVLSVLVVNSAQAANEKGKQLYETNCLACHGEKGDGMGPAGEAVKARDFSSAKNFKNGASEKQVIDSIKKGVEGTAMAGYAYLKDDELKALAQYVLSFTKAKK